MSGYLERMLRSTARNEHRLRPLAGSIFGKRENALTLGLDGGPGKMAKSGEESEWGENRQPTVSPGTSARDAKAHAEDPVAWPRDYAPLQAPRRGRVTSGTGRQEAGDLSRADTDKNANDERHFVRRVEQLGEELRATVKPGSRSDATGGRAVTDLGGSLANRSPEQTERITRNAVEIRESEQTRGELVSQRAVQPIVTARQSAYSSERQNGPLHDSARNAAAETPDVQVHIGRIEVVAVQPQAPALPTPRRPRTTSLADYLAGRNGR